MAENTKDDTKKQDQGKDDLMIDLKEVACRTSTKDHPKREEDRIPF